MFSNCKIAILNSQQMNKNENENHLSWQQKKSSFNFKIIINIKWKQKQNMKTEYYYNYFNKKIKNKNIFKRIICKFFAQMKNTWNTKIKEDFFKNWWNH